jgi:hypothetical protein
MRKKTISILILEYQKEFRTDIYYGLAELKEENNKVTT